MATETKTKTKVPSQGKGGGKLNKKYGPLPLKIWLGILAGIALLAYLYYRHKNNATPALTNDATGYSPLVSPQQAASAGTPSPNSPPASQLDPSTLDALGLTPATDYVTTSDLQSQLDNLQSGMAASIAAATLTGPQGPPGAPGKDAKTPAATKNAHPVAKATHPTGNSVATRYFTFAPGKAPKGKKTQEIKLKKGQSLKYKPGKGYYAV